MVRLMEPTNATNATNSDSSRRDTAATSRSPLRLDRQADGIAVLTFDQPDSSANLFDAACFDALEVALETIKADSSITGIILYSAKPNIFFAGADIEQFLQSDDEQRMRDLVRRGQRIFHVLAELPIPSVAAIHGACVGGGCEMALACDYRIASPDKVTNIGLPEINLGILPGWGGCFRLPRLVGLPLALDMICAGKLWPAKLAKTRGLVDQIVPHEHLLRLASTWLCKGKRRTPALWKTNNRLVAAIAERRARASILKKTEGHYPAPLRALDVILQGLRADAETSFQLEEDGIIELAGTRVSRNLIRLFFMQEAAKKLRIAKTTPERVEHVAVIGAGVMGAGIAQWSSARGFAVMLQDISAEALARGMTLIESLYDQALSRCVFSSDEARQGLDRVTPIAGHVSLAACDLVIEAAVEDMAVKKTLFAELEQRAGKHTVLATNTSALSITELGSALKDAGRLVGIHYFNPVHRMQLVEVIVGKKTRPDAIATAVRFVQDSGKLPVVVQDRPGFLVNRILIPYLMEAGRLIELGLIVDQIDAAMLAFGMPMGPLRLLDEIGLDVAVHVGRFFEATFPDRVQLPKTIEQLAEAGRLGKKSGTGFYRYEGKRDPLPHPDMGQYARSNRLAHLQREALQERLLALIVNEAARCLDEGVVDSPADVDLAMVFGTGFAPFHGGPLRVADRAGLGKIVRNMEQLAEHEGPAFVPCEYLARLARNGQTFYPEAR